MRYSPAIEQVRFLTPTPLVIMLCVHFQSQTYQAPYLYFWRQRGPACEAAPWPGLPMTSLGNGRWQLSLPQVSSGYVIISDAGERQSPTCYVMEDMQVEEGLWPHAQADPVDQPGPARPLVGQEIGGVN